MINKRIAVAILNHVAKYDGGCAYKNVRLELKAVYKEEDEPQIWREIQNLIDVDKTLCRKGEIPGNRDRMLVDITSAGRKFLAEHCAEEDRGNKTPKAESPEESAFSKETIDW